MSSIGEQFGDLAALFGGEGEAPSDGATPTHGKGRDDQDVLGSGNVAGGQPPAHGQGHSQPATSADQGHPQQTETAGGSASLSTPSGISATSEAAVADPTFESTLIATICDLNGMSSDDFDLDASLTTDLDIQGLPLWALVAELERFAGAKFPDPVVESWQTPRDILDAPRDQA